MALGLVLTLGWSAACGPPAVEPHAAPEIFSSYLDQRVPALLEHFDIPGASLSLVEGARLTWSKAYGEADRARARPMTPETVLQAASISKTVTAWGVMRLVEQGRVELDAPADGYLTRWHLPQSTFAPEGVTVRRLLSHNAGVSYALHSHRMPDVPLPSIEEALAGDRGAEEPAHLVHAPGASFLYSNAGYAMLQLLIEEVTRRPFGEYMKTEVLLPLGMRSSSFEWEEALRPRTATGYVFDGEPAPNYLHAAQGVSGLFTTAPDLARFAAAGMHGSPGGSAGRGVLSPVSAALLYTPVVDTRGIFALASDAYGLGYFAETLPSGQQAVMHGGENEGWISQFYSIPETGDGIVILTNSERSQRFVAEVAADWAMWRGLAPPKMSRSLRRVAFALRGAVAFFFLASLWLGGRLVQGIASGTRGPDPSFGRPRSRRLAQSAVAVLILALWWGFGHGSVVHLFPVITPWVALSLSACAGLVWVSALFPAHGDGTAKAVSRSD
jgi:CubicO group peptidase (beta-lactamase class C family)